MNVVEAEHSEYITVDPVQSQRRALLTATKCKVSLSGTYGQINISLP